MEERAGEDLDRIRAAFPFPDPRDASPDGLLAYGGDLVPARLLAAYASGIFPWYDEDPILWFSPDPRWVLRPSALHVGRNLSKLERRAPFELRMDTAFDSVIRHCAAAPRPGQDGTWINAEMIEAYCELHRLGFAHCVEAWSGEDLVGGLYGVSLGRAFFGESMFARRDDASKLAFVALVRQLERWDFRLIDCQVHTAHLERFGAMALPRELFLSELDEALAEETRRGRWSFDSKAAPAATEAASNAAEETSR